MNSEGLPQDIKNDMINFKKLIEQEEENRRQISFSRVLFFSLLSLIFLFVYAAILSSGTQAPILSLLLNMGTEFIGSLIVAMVPLVILRSRGAFKIIILNLPRLFRRKQGDAKYIDDNDLFKDSVGNFIGLLFWSLLIGAVIAFGLIAVFALDDASVNFDLVINLISEFFGALAVYSILNQAIQQLSKKNPILEEATRLEGKYNLGQNSQTDGESESG